MSNQGRDQARFGGHGVVSSVTSMPDGMSRAPCYPGAEQYDATAAPVDSGDRRCICPRNHTDLDMEISLHHRMGVAVAVGSAPERGGVEESAPSIPGT